jgi:hypothetical protein
LDLSGGGREDRSTILGLGGRFRVVGRRSHGSGRGGVA